MYGMKCAHCGQVELAHLENLEEHIRQNYRLLPDREHAEELHIERVEELTEHQEGYKHHLVTCPGFDYPEDMDLQDLAVRVKESPAQLGYLPDELAGQVRAELERMEDERPAGSHNAYGGAATYMFFDHRTGTSHIIFAE
jgi:hypothetical protein